ncbi:MAG: sulfotransferase domain-containing protein [Elusimicrobia bacterium]|nr:sulfotransferase domain-containing protein [Elusimicrobiota bacterium]
MVDGITRAGKFLLGSVISAFEGLEFIQYSLAFETMLILHRLGKMDLDTLRALSHLEMDSMAFNMAIGRSLNGRQVDLSCINRAPDAASFLARAAVEDREELVRRFKEERRLPLHICHEGLPSAPVIFELFPKVRLVSILRDPAALAMSWFKRGWGRRSGANDGQVFSLFFTAPGEPRPWWALDWQEDYAQLSEMERCVLSIAALQNEARRGFEAAGGAASGRVCFVRYDTLVEKPDAVLATMAGFLGRKPGPALSVIMTQQRLPGALPAGQRMKHLEAIAGLISPRYRPVLEQACAEYDGYWKDLSV